MYCPCSRTIAAVQMVVIILRVTTGGDSLRSGRGHLPAAAIHTAAGLAGSDRNNRAIHFFQRVLLMLIGVDRECQVKTAAGTLRGSCPFGRIILRFGNTWYVWDFSAACGATCDFLAHQRYDLPRVACGRVVNVSVVTVFAGLHGNATFQFLGSGNVSLCRVAVGIVFDNPLLSFIVDFADKVRLFSIRAHNDRLAVQHIQTQLAEAAPNVDLVCIVIAGGVLAGFKAGYMRKAIGRTTFWLAVQAVAAAVGLLAVEPDKPSTALFGDAGNLAGGIRRGRPCRKSCNAVVFVKLRRGRIFRQLHMDGFLQLLAIWGCVDKLRGEIGRGFHIESCGCCRLLCVGLVQDLSQLGLVGGDEVIVGGRIAEKFYAIRQDDFGCRTVCGIFRLHQQRNDCIVGIGRFADSDVAFVCVQRICIHVGILTVVQVGPPRGNADFCLAGCHRQTHAAEVAAGRCIRQIVVQIFGNLRKVWGYAVRNFGNKCICYLWRGNLIGRGSRDHCAAHGTRHECRR